MLLLLSSVESLLAADPTVPQRVTGPLTPDESLKHFRLDTGLKMELVAAEPEVIDPVSIAFDEAGTLWAVEMTDYPNGPEPGQPPLSRIRALRDMDGDGRYETSKIFADKLLFATGVQPWKGGVIVTLAGEIAWFKDSDGDGTADVRQTWFRGFAQQNPQLRANHPRWGLDNRIYVANGLRGGVVKPDTAHWGRELPDVALTGFDFRFNPLTGEAEPISGVGQFGMTFDDFGHRFVCSNRNPCRQIILEDRYLKRNPLLAVKDVGSDAVPSGADSHVYPLSRAWTTSTTHAGQFTAACGVTIYRGWTLPADYYGNAFTCEPTGNLVHREVLVDKSVAFTSKPSTATTEFLATPDEWFRPVDLANGPDGALYVVDMYRAVIEHPEWVPDELKNRSDERDGSDRGRIYRIVRTDTRPPTSPAFQQESTVQLVQRLACTESWQAETAARLLVERQAPDSKPALLEFARTCKSAQGRWRAYRLLTSFDATVTELAGALADGAPQVRELGVLLVEPFLADQPELLQRVMSLVDDPDHRVRFQVALSLGSVSQQDSAIDPLAALMWRDSQDEWIRRAVLSSLAPDRIEPFCIEFMKSLAEDQAPKLSFIAALHDVNNLVGATLDRSAIRQSLKQLLLLTNDPLRLAGVLGLCRGIQRRGQSPRTLLAEVTAQDKSLEENLEGLFKRAMERAMLKELPLPDRLEALSLLEFSPRDNKVYLMLLVTFSEQEIVIKAIDIIATYDIDELGGNLISLYASKTPEVRRAIVRALLRNPARTRQLLQAITDKHISLAELDPNQVKALLNHADKQIKQQAQQVLAAAIPQERKVVLEQYQAALKVEADPQRGRVVFEKSCATCHQIGKLGVNVGPDIADLRTKTPAQVLTDILNPNQAIDNNYVSYTVVTKDGRIETGFIAAETAASITLKQPENKTQLILRDDIDELKSNGVSLMPEGLEKNITVQQMADVISFVKNWRYLDGQVPINIKK